MLGGITSGAAYALALWLAASALKAALAGPLQELVGLDRVPRRWTVVFRELGLTGGALGFLLAGSTLLAAPLTAEPFSIALLMEAVYLVLAWVAGQVSRVFHRGTISDSEKE